MPGRVALRIALGAVAALFALAQPASADLDTTPARTTSGLAFPWEVVPLPDGRMLVTERSAHVVRVIESDGTLRVAPAYTDTDPKAYKVLGMALSPDFADNHFVYVYETHWTSGAGRDNTDASSVVRLRWDGTNLVEPQTIFDAGIWSDGNHDGGRIAFGPDGKLYVTTGDVHDKDLPQNLDRLNGKILRLNEDGSAPAGNPFPGPGLRQYVWSYGHRHPEGIAWDAEGRMWETEHGPSRGAGPYTSANENTYLSRDEINRIEPGCNYGWPVITGEQTAQGMSSPVVYSGTTQAQTWAPGGLAVGADDRLYVPSLYGQALRSYPIQGDGLGDVQLLFKNSAYARLRTAVTFGTSLLVATSNSTTASPTADKVLVFPFAQPVSALLPPPVRAAGPCPGLPPVTATGTTPAAGAAPASGATPTSAVPSRREIATELEALLAAQSKALGRHRSRALARLARIGARASTLPARRLSLSLAAMRGRRRIPFASGSAATGTGRPVVVTLRSTRSSRRAIARLARTRPRLTLVLTARLRTADGRLVSESRRFATRRAG